MRSFLASLVLFALAGCESLDRGTREDATKQCAALCEIQAHAEGCTISVAECRKRCADDALGSEERCLLAAQDYYTCSAEVLWACPVAPDRPETEDARCAAEEHAWLVCKVTGDVPPE